MRPVFNTRHTFTQVKELEGEISEGNKGGRFVAVAERNLLKDLKGRVARMKKEG